MIYERAKYIPQDSFGWTDPRGLEPGDFAVPYWLIDLAMELIRWVLDG